MVNLSAHISRTRAEALQYAKEPVEEKDELRVYADGSRYHGGMGGAARAEIGRGTVVVKEYLGSSERHRAVEGEIVGAISAVKIIKAEPSITRAAIFIDCQQAIRELASGRSKHTRLLQRFQEEVRGMKKSLQIRLVWVPAHEGIAMNELVDQDAKDAALGESTAACL